MLFRMNSERKKVPGLVIPWIIQTAQCSEVSAFPHTQLRSLLLLSLYTPVQVWAGCPWFSTCHLPRNTESVARQRHRLQLASSPLPLKYKLASLVFDHGLFLKQFFILYFYFPWLLPRPSPLQNPLPSHPISSNPLILHPCFSLFIFQIKPWLLLPLLFHIGFCGLLANLLVYFSRAHEISPRWHCTVLVFSALTGFVFF